MDQDRDFYYRLLGKKLPDGATADKNYIWFSQWQLDNINSGNLISIDLPGYTQLKTSIARSLVPHLQEWLFASQRDGRFEKKYEDVCHLLGIRVYRYRSEIERNFALSLNELVELGYISKWAIETMASKNAYKLVLWHGPKYHSDRKARLEKNPHHKKQTAQLIAAVAAEEHQPQKLFDGHLPSVDQQLLEALMSRRVLEKKAREVLSGLPTDFPIVDTLEWVDQLIAAEPHKFTNPAGFYVYNLQGRATPPPSFESSRQRKAREEAQARADSEYYEKQQRELEYEEYSSTNLNSSPGLCLSLRSKSSLPSAARTLDSLRRRLRR